MSGLEEEPGWWDEKRRFVQCGISGRIHIGWLLKISSDRLEMQLVVVSKERHDKLESERQCKRAYW